MTRPLPEDVARTARAYLAALVPPAEVSDAWHELVADVTYWGEHEVVPVVRLAHQVAVQHQPVTPEVAVLALQEVGIDQPSSIARILDVDEDVARGWTRQVAASVERDAGAHPGAGAGGATVDGVSRAAPSHASVDGGPSSKPAARAVDVGARVEPTEDGGDAVRIGFDEDGPLPGLDDLDSPASTTPRRGMVVAAVAVAVLLLLAVWLLGR